MKREELTGMSLGVWKKIRPYSGAIIFFFAFLIMSFLSPGRFNATVLWALGLGIGTAIVVIELLTNSQSLCRTQKKNNIEE